MNILIVVRWDQTEGGVASVVANLAKHLRERGHGVFFFHPSRRDLMASTGKTKLGFPDFRMRLALPLSAARPILSTVAFCLLLPLMLAQLLMFIRRNNIHVINVHYPMASFVLFAICRRLASIKLVTSIHGADIFPNGRARGNYHKALRYLLVSSDLIVANSRAFQKEFLTIFPQLHEKTTVIHNGLDPAEFEGRDRFQLETDGRYILCIAAHNEKKGLDVLLRAFAEIIRVETELKLILAGDGPLRPQLEDLALSLRLNSHVLFVGSQNRKEIARLLHGCELFILPSRSEPFGIAIIEAMACGKPVVATNIGGIPEIITTGNNGILVEADRPSELAAAVIAVLSDASLKTIIAQNAQTTVNERFLWKNTGEAYEKVFARLRGSVVSGVAVSATANDFRLD